MKPDAPVINGGIVPFDGKTGYDSENRYQEGVIMMQNVLKGVFDAAVDDDGIWMISDDWNALFKYSFSKQEVEPVDVFPEEVGANSFAFCKIIKMENEIYLFPQTAKDIFYYNISERRFYRFYLSFDGFFDAMNIGVVVRGKDIYCINRFPDLIIKIDSITKKVKVFSSNNKSCINNNVEKCIYRFYKNPCIYKNRIIFPNYGGLLTVFDLKNENFTVEALKGLEQENLERTQELFEGGLEDWIVDVCAFDDRLWLFSFNGKIYQYIDETNELEEVMHEDYIYCKDKGKLIISFLGGAISLEDELWIIPQYKNKCMKYNRSTKQFEAAFDNYMDYWTGYQKEYTVCMKLSENNMLIYSYYEGCFYILNSKTEGLQKMQLEISCLKNLKKNPKIIKLFKNNNLYKIDDLPFICQEICGERKKADSRTEAESNIGRKIYAAIKKEVI